MRWRVQRKSDNEVRKDTSRMRKVQDRLNEVGQGMCGERAIEDENCVADEALIQPYNAHFYLLYNEQLSSRG